MKTYNCSHCDKESKSSHQKMNVYCSVECSAAGRAQETHSRFLNGLVTERVTLRKLLVNTVGGSCASCGLTDWCSKPITLQVDHKDGNAGNNMPANLQLLCPNCHSQTSTYGGKNKGNGRKARGLPLK